jgi:hypothetical protein
MTANLTGATMAECGSAIVRSLRGIGATTVRHVAGEPMRYIVDPQRLNWVTPHKLVQGISENRKPPTPTPPQFTKTFTLEFKFPTPYTPPEPRAGGEGHVGLGGWGGV